MSNSCPPQSASQTVIDVRSPTSCIDTLNQVLNAYYSVISGSQRVTVRFNERWAEYQKGNAEELRQLYMQLYAQCPNAAASGLPNLNPNLRARRGPPARGLTFFGRL